MFGLFLICNVEFRKYTCIDTICLHDHLVTLQVMMESEVEAKGDMVKFLPSAKGVEDLHEA